jgi:hypothetical protein
MKADFLICGGGIVVLIIAGTGMLRIVQMPGSGKTAL